MQISKRSLMAFVLGTIFVLANFSNIVFAQEKVVYHKSPLWVSYEDTMIEKVHFDKYEGLKFRVYSCYVYPENVKKNYGISQECFYPTSPKLSGKYYVLYEKNDGNVPGGHVREITEPRLLDTDFIMEALIDEVVRKYRDDHTSVMYIGGTKKVTDYSGI